MRPLISTAFLGLIASCSPAPETPTNTLDIIPKTERQSGFAFLTQETKDLQTDDFANPGLLWVDRGAETFAQAPAGTESCVSCHQDHLAGVAARYPAVDTKTGALLNLEMRINQCRTTHQNLSPLAYESDELLSLTSYVAHQSQGHAIEPDVSESALTYRAEGETYFFTRRGQFNLSCAQCHNDNWGKQLRGDTISQGHGNGFPAYRLEWQSLGSLQRRLRDCDTGVRAEPLPYGDPTYVALELYLAARAEGLSVETPAVRR